MQRVLQTLSHPAAFVASVAGLGITGIGYNQWRKGNRQPKESTRLTDQKIIITGADSGLGKAATKALLYRKARVIMACRDLEKCRAARREIVKATNNKKVYCRHLDLASVASVKEFTERVLKEDSNITALITNAAIMSPKELKTAEGIELHLGVNHLNQALLAQLLRPTLEANQGRILHVSCLAAKSPHATLDPDDPNFARLWEDGGRLADTKAYARSKLMAQLWHLRLARELATANSDLTVNVVDPGVARTGLERYQKWANTNWSVFFWNGLRAFSHAKAETVAERLVYLATSPKLKDVNGAYFERTEVAEPAQEAAEEAVGDWVWAFTDSWSRRPQVAAALANPNMTFSLDSKEVKAKEAWLPWLASQLHLR